MKPHQMLNLDEIRPILRTELEKCFITGYSYGAKSFCQVVKDKLDNFTNEDKSSLIADISDFCNKTLDISAEKLRGTLEETRGKIDDILGKDKENAE